MIFLHWTVSLWSVISISHASTQNLTIGNVILSDTYFYGQSPPFYPTPQVSGIGGWSQYVDQARSLVSQMTLEEKVMMTGGIAQTNNSCGGFIPPIPISCVVSCQTTRNDRRCFTHPWFWINFAATVSWKEFELRELASPIDYILLSLGNDTGFSVKICRRAIWRASAQLK